MQIKENFEVGDLEQVLEPKLHIDEFCSKIGNDADIIVLSFLVNDKHAAMDIVDFFEKGYDFILDADISASEIKPGSYLVFVELLRRRRVIEQVFKLIEDLKGASDLDLKQWKFRYINDENYMPLTSENIKKRVPLSPKAYKEQIKTPIDEMRQLSGIALYPQYDVRDLEIQRIQHGAGIK